MFGIIEKFCPRLSPNSLRLESFKDSLKNLSSSTDHLRSCRTASSVKGPPWKILFFGSDSFSLESLKPLCSKLKLGTLMSSLGVVSKPGTAVRKYAELENLPTYDWPPKPIAIEGKYDLGMVVSFGNLIPKSIIDLLPLGCINVHASLLPRWRGAAPIIHAILNGDTETGVTVMRIHPHKFDVGEIVRQYRVPIGVDETAKELEEKLAYQGAKLLMECLRDLPRCIEMATPQPKEGITYAPKIKPSLAFVKWNEMKAQEVYNLHRALSHVYPLLTKWYGRNVKLLSIDLVKESTKPKKVTEGEVLDPQGVQRRAFDFLKVGREAGKAEETTKEKPSTDNVTLAGTLKYLKEEQLLKIFCASDSFIAVRELSVSGKVMSALDFYNGFLSKETQQKWRFH